jgi:hypothetical protein
VLGAGSTVVLRRPNRAFREGSGDEFHWAILRFRERGVGLCERDGGEFNIRAGDLRARSHFSPMARYFCYLTDNLRAADL